MSDTPNLLNMDNFVASIGSILFLLWVFTTLYIFKLFNYKLLFDLNNLINNSSPTTLMGLGILFVLVDLLWFFIRLLNFKLNEIINKKDNEKKSKNIILVNFVLIIIFTASLIIGYILIKINYFLDYSLHPYIFWVIITLWYSVLGIIIVFTPFTFNKIFFSS